jgi:hypothetical protein
MNNFYKNLSMWLVIGLTAVVLVKLLGAGPESQISGSMSRTGRSTGSRSRATNWSARLWMAAPLSP